MSISLFIIKISVITDKKAKLVIKALIDNFFLFAAKILYWQTNI